MNSTYIKEFRNNSIFNNYTIQDINKIYYILTGYNTVTGNYEDLINRIKHLYSIEYILEYVNINSYKELFNKLSIDKLYIVNDMLKKIKNKNENYKKLYKLSNQIIKERSV